MTAQSGRVVLVVEDEWLVRMEICEALKNAGWDVIEARSGEEAANLFDRGTRVSVLVTDIRLGGELSGWDIAELFRAANPALGVIYASANPPVLARQVPKSVFIGKPAMMDELVSHSDSLWVRD